MKAPRPAAPSWCRHLAHAEAHGLMSASPAYELHAPRALRFRALALALVGVACRLLTLGRLHA